jgi:hypothetical protein
MLAVRYGPPREEPAEFVGEDGEGFQFTDDYAVRLSSAEAAGWFERNGYDLPDDLASSQAGTVENGGARGEEMTVEARALATLVRHPDWTDTQVAKYVGCSRTTLYDYPSYKAARQSQKSSNGRIPRGWKDGRTGVIEARNE